MDVSEIQSLIEEFASVSLDMDPEQLTNTHKACAVLGDMATERCREVIRIASSGPLLQVFMSDGWSCDMRNTVASAHGEPVPQMLAWTTSFVHEHGGCSVCECRL